jgi:hypothetical protein
MTEEELRIVRAINFCLMNEEKLKQLAVKESTTVGELYVKVAREDVNKFFEIWKKKN